MEAQRRRFDTRTGSATAAPKTTLSPSATCLVPADSTPKTPREIRQILEQIDKGLVEKYFLDEESKRDENDEMDGCAPYLVAENVSREAFYKYYNRTRGEGLPFKLRSLELSDDNSLWIVDLNSLVHERTKAEFHDIFVFDALGQARSFKWSLGSPTIEVVPGHFMEADLTYGPKPNVPFSVRPQGLLASDEWITFVVDIGRWQTWESLQGRALLWYNYPGIQYILLLKVSKHAVRMSYELYDVALNPLNPQNPTVLPAVSRREFSHDGGPQQQLISLDTRRIFGIPPTQPLPNGVASTADVNLRTVMDSVVV